MPASRVRASRRLNACLFSRSFAVMTVTLAGIFIRGSAIRVAVTTVSPRVCSSGDACTSAALSCAAAGIVHAAPSAASATASAKFRFVIAVPPMPYTYIPLYARKKAVPEGTAAFSHEKSLPSCPSQDAVARTIAHRRTRFGRSSGSASSLPCLPGFPVTS